MQDHEVAPRREQGRPPPKRGLDVPVPVIISLACLAVICLALAAYGALHEPQYLLLPRWLTVGSCVAAAAAQISVVVRGLIGLRDRSR